MQIRGDAKQRRIEELESVVAQAYQLAGAIGAPVRVLDVLSAAVKGRPLPSETFLPIAAEECDEVARRQRVIDQVREVLGTSAAQDLGRLGGRQRSAAKARAARANGRKGGRPNGSQVRSGT